MFLVEEFLWENFLRRISGAELLWKNFRGSNFSGRFLGRNLSLSDFVFEEGGDAVNFSENFGR